MEDSDMILYPSITVCITGKLRSDYDRWASSDRTPNLTELLYYVRTHGPNKTKIMNPEKLFNRDENGYNIINYSSTIKQVLEHSRASLLVVDMGWVD